jgi:hypothetical protein
VTFFRAEQKTSVAGCHLASPNRNILTKLNGELEICLAKISEKFPRNKLKKKIILSVQTKIV